MAFLDELKSAWEYVSWIEPALGKVSREEIARVEAAIATMEEHTGELDELEEDDYASAAGAVAVLYARAAALALAANDEPLAHRWLDEGETFADDAYAEQLAAGRRTPERFRRLVHGRYLIANGRDNEAHALWRELVKENGDDAIAEAARIEQKAPRPLKDGQMPTLWTYNGIGLGFAGARDHWDDGSYATTQCFKLLWIPIWPIRAYRVAGGEDETYYVLARESLSTFAKISRYVVVALIALSVGGVYLHSHLNDPTRLAKQRWDDTFERVASANPEQALRELDARIKDDIWRVGGARAERAGAEIVRIAAGMVPKPFTVAAIDHAGRVVRRYEALPQEARGGAARDALLAALDGWIAALGTGNETAEARLELLRHAERNSDARRQGPLLAKIEATRLAAADAKAETAPLEALAMYVERPSTDAMARADKIVEQLATAPAMLADAGQDLETWKAATANTALRDQVAEKVDDALVARAEAQFEEVTPKQLAAMVKKQPWNQWAQLELANLEIEAGKLEAAHARLTALAKPTLMVREVRQTLAQLASALGRLEEADTLLTGLLGSRLARFQKVAAEYDDLAKKAQEKLVNRLRYGDVPYELQIELGRGTEEQQRELVGKWITEQLEADPAIKAKRDAYLALGDVVPAALAAGGVKLRRAQAVAGAERDAMLAEAERMFLAIRTEAEGQPEFRIGLGEVYARLGKTKESEEQFAAVLAMHNPELSMHVARVYRGIGSTERAKEVAKQVFASSESPIKDNAAVLLGIMYDSRGEEAEAESWFRKANQADPMVRVSLLELEARRLMRAGKLNECATKYAEVAKLHLKSASSLDVAGYNNAALAHQSRYACSGDESALVDAETTLEKAYRVRSDEPILVSNLATLHESNARRRVLGKRVNLGVLQATTTEVDALIDLLLDGPDRDAVLADLAADRGSRRSRELFKQYAVLAPNSVGAYLKLAAEASDLRDEAALAAIVDAARRAKGLDTSEVARTREKLVAGEMDALITEGADANLEQFDGMLAQRKLDPRTRAAILVTAGALRGRVGLYRKDVALVRAGRAQVQQGAKLWPALSTRGTLTTLAIDEAGLAADAEQWLALRRVWSAAAALTKLSEDKSPLASQVLGSESWKDVRTLAQEPAGTPGLDDLRIARLLGDPAIETRAKAVLDNKRLALMAELALVVDPTSTAAAADRALFEKR